MTMSLFLKRQALLSEPTLSQKSHANIQIQDIYMQNFSLKRQACQVFFIFLVKTSGPEASLLTLVCREKRELFIHEVFNLLPHCGT